MKTVSLNYRLFPFLIFLALVRCAPVYIPTTHQTPMFTGKKEFYGSVGVSPSLNVQSAVSVSNHIAITASYLYSQINDHDYGRKHHAGELGGGYYTNFDN